MSMVGLLKKVVKKFLSIKKERGYVIITFLKTVSFRLKLIRRRYIPERIMCKLISRFAKVRKNKYIFLNSINFQYSCNTKYIANELLKRNLDLDLVFASTKQTDKRYLPKEFRCVRYTSFRFVWELMTSRVWVSNSHMFLPIKMGLKKNKDTFYFQTFHGSMGIKKFDGDVEDVYRKLGWLPWQKKHVLLLDYLFTDSQIEADAFKTAFWGHGCIEKLGKARDCIFYLDREPYLNKVKEFFKIPKENKIVLYAPTWRPDKRTYCFNIDFKLLRRTLKKRFGGEWSILIRTHNHMRKVESVMYDVSELINTASYYDMQELLVAADVLISDYSSCIPEYVILKKPSFIYAPDQDYYDNSNGFYYPLATLPSPIAKDNGELVDNILNFDEDRYKKEAEEFLVKMGHQDDENSCVRIVDFILSKARDNA